MIILVGLKLFSVIDWSWWLVCLPAIIYFLNWAIVEILDQSIISGRPWAIKLGRWIYNIKVEEE